VIARLGQALSAFFARTAPDPFVIAVALTLLTALLAVVFGYDGAPTPGAKAAALVDAWRGPDGLWKFLAFGMQMALILVTGHALAASTPVRALITRLASIPRSPRAACALVGLTASLFGLVNWGLGLIVGALFAREVARALRARSIRVHGPLLAASGYAGMLVWHGGLSGSAPLKMTSREEAAGVLPDRILSEMGEAAVPLSETIFSPMNLFVALGLLAIVPITLALLNPKDDAAIVEMPIADEPAPAHDDPPRRTLPEFLDRSPVVVWVLALALGAAFVRFATERGLTRMGPNEINLAMLALGLACHGSVRSYLAAAEDGARGCAGIILQFPLYAGIMGMAENAGLIESFATWLGSLATETTAPLLTFLSAAVVNLFVPSGGGQWGIQGPVALAAGAEVGVSPAKMIMSVAYGDQLTNMLQPFWALPLLAITKVRARDIVGYTCVVMLAAGAWMALALLVF